MAEAQALSCYLKASVRKVVPVLDAIRTKNAEEALRVLDFMPKRCSKVVAKTVRSALNNLGQKVGKKIEPRQCWINRCLVSQGPATKRLHAGSMGRAMPYKRLTCHLRIVVRDQP